MRYWLLGQLELSDGGRPVEVAGAKQRTLLAILLLHANRVVSTEMLIDGLWEDDPPAGAPKALQVHVSQLRKVLGKGRLQTKPPGYVLQLEADELDLERFERLAQEGRLDEALALWRGPPLGEFAYQQFAQAEIARLEELHLGCLEGRIERDLADRCDAELVAELEALVTEHPLRERLRYQLMLALYRTGRQAEALETYQEGRERLVDDLGIEPGRELRELQQAILRQDSALEAVTGESRRAGATRGVFVGREHELALLEAALVDAFAGRGSLFLLAGEPGIGKTRLTEELADWSRARGARVLVGRCWEAGGAPAYWPWVQALRSYVRDADPALLRGDLGAGATDLAQILPELRHQLPDLGDPPSLDSEGARFRLFDATAEFLRSASRRAPLLLVLDDLHAADASSLLLLRFVARQIGSSRLLLVAALRNADPVPGEELLAALAELGREHSTHQLSLGGLSQSDVAAYLTAAAVDVASSELVADLHDETEGNPLFVSEMVKLFALEGIRPHVVPETVRDVISRRLAHLSPECNRILVLAAMLGREFEVDVLGRLAAIEEEDLLETLDEAMTARIVSDIPGNTGRLRFAHLLFRDTLYDGLTSARRVLLHRQVVVALESVAPDRQPALAELAHHAVAAADFDRGLEYARRAGDQAMTLLAYEEAARLYRVALDASDRSRGTDPQIRCDLLLSLGEAQSLAGEGEPAGVTYQEAAELARREHMPDRLARAALGFSGRGLWGTRAEVQPRLAPLLREALAACGEADSPLRATLLARLASSMRGSTDRGQPAALADQAVEMSLRLGDRRVQLYAIGSRLAATRGPETIEQCAADGLELVRLAEELGDEESAFNGHENLAYIAWTLGQRQQLEEELETLARLARSLRQPANTWASAALRLILEISEGRIARAEERHAHVFGIGEEAQDWIAVSGLTLQTFALRRWRCELEGHDATLRESVARLGGYRIFECALALAYAETGRDREARDAFEQLAVDDFAQLARDEDWLVNMCLVSDVCIQLRDVPRGATLYQQLSPFASLIAFAQTELDLGPVARSLGGLAGLVGADEDAVHHYQEALDLCERMGTGPWRAQTDEDLAHLLVARDAPGDRERARQLLDEALGIYQAIALPVRAERCADAIAAL